jgi:hypothetical protein
MSHFYSGDFAVAVAVSGRVATYPFPGDRVSRVFAQDFMQRLADFESLALDTPNDDDPNAYLVDESEVTPVGGGVVQWTRTWAHVPRSRREVQTFSHTIPGIDTASSFLLRAIVSVVSIAGGRRVTTTGAHLWTADDIGELVSISYWVKDESEQILFQRLITTTITAIHSTTEVDVGYWNEPLPVATWNNISLAQVARQPIQRVVTSWVHVDYFLPGVSPGIKNESQIPILQPSIIFDSSGNATNSYGEFTTPSVVDYRALVRAKSLIVVEPSSLRRWSGNIFERATRYTIAI